MKINTNLTSAKKEVLKAVKQKGWVLKYASDDLKNDKEFLKLIIYSKK
jgi:hypothetical protein